MDSPHFDASLDEEHLSEDETTTVHIPGKDEDWNDDILLSKKVSKVKKATLDEIVTAGQSLIRYLITARGTNIAKTIVFLARQARNHDESYICPEFSDDAVSQEIELKPALGDKEKTDFELWVESKFDLDKFYPFLALCCVRAAGASRVFAEKGLKTKYIQAFARFYYIFENDIPVLILAPGVWRQLRGMFSARSSNFLDILVPILKWQIIKPSTSCAVAQYTVLMPHYYDGMYIPEAYLACCKKLHKYDGKFLLDNWRDDKGIEFHRVFCLHDILKDPNMKTFPWCRAVEPNAMTRYKGQRNEWMSAVLTAFQTYRGASETIWAKNCLKNNTYRELAEKMVRDYYIKKAENIIHPDDSEIAKKILSSLTKEEKIKFVSGF